MTVNRTTLLDLPLPVTGTESGTWGDTTNNGLTQYVDIAIAGMSNLTSANFTAGALTIETTEGDSSATNISATSAQYAGFRVTSLAANSTITVGNTGTSPARSYRLINADATYSLTFKATGQTGVTLLPGQSALVAFNGTDYVIVGTVGAGSTTDNTVPRFDGTTGKILQSSGITIDDSNNVSGVAQLNITTLDATNIEVTNIKAKDGTAAASIADSTGVISVTANPILSGGTANGVLYLDGSKVATSGSALTFDGTTLVSGSSGTTTKLILQGGAQTSMAIKSSTGTSGFLIGRGYASDDANSFFLYDLATSQNRFYIDTTPNIFQYATAHVWNNAANSTEYMRLTSTGLGIGTSSPNSKIDAYYAATPIGATTWGTSATLRAGTGSFSLTGANNRGIGTLIHTNQNSNTTLPYGGNYEVFGLLSATNSATGGGYEVYGVAAYSKSDGSAFAIRADAVNTAGTPGTSAYGLYVGSVSGAANNFGIYVNDTSANNYIGGNLGLGVTPSAWSSGYKAIEFGSGSIYGRANATDIYLSSNAYLGASTFIYKYTGAASYYSQAQGGHYWFNAPSGTAGNAITFTQAMTLDASGNLGIGTTQVNTGLSVWKTNATTGFTIGNTNGTANLLDYTTPSAIGVGGRLVFGATYYIGGNTMGTGYIGTYKENAPSNAGDEYNHSLVFGSSNGSVGLRECGRFNSTGQLLVNTTVTPANGGFLVVNSGISTSTTNVIELQQATNGANKAAAAFGVSIGNGGQSTNAADLTFSTASGGSLSERARITSGGDVVVTGVGGLGYGTGSGGAVTQATSRTTGVTLDKTNGAITLVSAAGTTTWQTFTVTNNKVAATDTVIVNQKSGTDLYQIFVTNVAAGSFKISFATTGGTTTEQPVFNFAVIKAVTA